jgi:glutamate-1-semialdehyde 2,1-aminomutase
MQTDRYSTSRTLHDRAQQSIVGGVNSPARAFKSVGGDPVFAASADGCRVVDADGNSYIDYIGSWGPHIAGHTHPAVVAAIEEAAHSGTSFGMSTEAEIGLAETIRDMMPAIERLRMVNSGTEATMSALRLARGYTGRAKVIKFVGCYHGHGDSFLIKAGSGALTHGVPDSAGVTPGVAADTLVADYNDLDSVRFLVADHADDIAAIIVEPVVGNMGTVPPEPGFLEGLRTIADETGAVLIFDEVMTGFRVASGGAQERYGITPDLTTLGKIVGGGLPVGAYGGKREIMDTLAPLGPVYQAGTLSGNPLAVAAGRATLELLRVPGAYDRLEQAASMLTDGIAQAAETAGVPVTINRVGSMFTVFFNPGPVRSFEAATASDTELFARYFRGMLDRGVLLAPSQFEASFVSLAHDDDVISETISTAEEVFRHLS